MRRCVISHATTISMYAILLLQTELSQIISPFEIRLKIRSINQWKCFNGWTMDHMRNTPNSVWESSFDLSLGLAIKIRFVILCMAPVGFNTYQRTVYSSRSQCKLKTIWEGLASSYQASSGNSDVRRCSPQSN